MISKSTRGHNGQRSKQQRQKDERLQTQPQVSEAMQQPTLPSTCVTHVGEKASVPPRSGTLSVSSPGPPEAQGGFGQHPEPSFVKGGPHLGGERGGPMAQGCQVDSGLRDTRHTYTPSTRLPQHPSAMEEREGPSRGKGSSRRLPRSAAANRA
jgi:hypothetical protein